MRTPEPSAEVCREAFPASPNFPQLKVASDPRRMLDLFRRHLKPAAGKAYSIRDCTPVRFSWGKSGHRSVLQYDVQLVEPGGGRPRNTWITCLIHADPGETQQLWTELNAADATKQIPEPLLTLAPLTFIPELQMLAQVFPYDRRLDTLPQVMSGPSPEMQRRLLASFGSGDWQLEEQTVEALRYRMGVSGVARYTLSARNAATSRTETRRFYAKVYNGPHGGQSCERLQQLGERARATQNAFSVVQPVAYCHELRCLVLAEAPGRSLEEVFLSGGDSIAASCQVARALAAFHQSDLPAIRRHTAEEQLGYLKRTAALLRWACPQSRVLIHAIVNEVTGRLADGPCVPIHWDLKTDHIFLDDERVTFADLDTLSLGDPARDAAHLSAHIACRIGLSAMPADLARAASRAFLDEYFARVPSSWREQIASQYAIAAVEAACGVFKRQEPDWPGQVSAALDEARRALSGGFG